MLENNYQSELMLITQQEKELERRKAEILQKGKASIIQTILDTMESYQITQADITKYKQEKSMEGKEIIFTLKYKVKDVEKEFIYFDGKKGKIPDAITKMKKADLMEIAKKQGEKAVKFVEEKIFPTV